MASLAEELGLSLDSFVFVDDNPDERAMMRQLLPQVLTVELPPDPGRYRDLLSSLPQLQTLAVTEEDRARVTMYQAKRERDQLRDTAQTLDQYLASLEVVADIAPADEATLPRAHQLFQRTNQFNLTTRRYEPGELSEFSRDPDWRLYVMRARDRFGDHGLIAAALVHAGPDAWRVDGLVMSCRVIGYGLETTLLARICEDARDAGARTVRGEFVATRKNAPARDFYERHGFSPEEASSGDALRYRLELGHGGVARPVWVAEVATHAA
jgi:FkbH-like protein